MEAAMSGPDRDDDDLDAAYARAQALADEGRGPAASVRANVLAAAGELAARARKEDAAPPLAAVASPVTAVGRGRSMAVNLSSWRVRSGAAACAALLVALGAWRFDASHRVDQGVQVATASLELAAPPTRALPKDLPPAPLAAASTPYLPPPPVVEDPLERTPGTNAPSAKAAERDRQVVVAQADQADRTPRPAPSLEARAEARHLPAAAGVEATAAAPPAPAPEARNAQAPAWSRAPETRLAAAAAPAQLATLPPLPPSVVPRRIAVAPAAEPASRERDIVAPAAPESRRVDIAAASGRRPDAGGGVPVSLDAVGKPAAAADVAQARQPMTLQSAADRGDVDALRALLAEPAVRVDAPDATGRTALLHAVLAQQVAAVRLLLAAGADPARADQAGLTPRAAAQGGPNAEIAGLLAAPR
jgi:uncharacterized protein